MSLDNHVDAGREDVPQPTAASVAAPPDPLLVQGRGDLPDPRQGVLRRQRRRDRRLRGHDRQARLHPGAGRLGDLAAALLPLAAARRRLRHRRLPHHPPVLRHAQGRAAADPRGAPARAAGDHRAGDQPHLRPASLVPARAPGPAGFDQAQLLCLERHRQEVPGHADHLPRHREVELDLGSRGAGLFLASLLQPSARPQLRQSRGDAAGAERCCITGSRWASTGCGWTPSPTWSSARAPTARTCPRPTPS